MDCSQAHQFMEGLIQLFTQTDSLLWLYPFTWAVIIVRKLFYV